MPRIGHLIDNDSLALDGLALDLDGARVREQLHELLVLLVPRLHIFKLRGSANAAYV
jgi:hypothetical protein